MAQPTLTPREFAQKWGDKGKAWAAGRQGRGRLLDLTEGARWGGIDWAGCADAARRLS